MCAALAAEDEGKDDGDCDSCTTQSDGSGYKLNEALLWSCERVESVEIEVIRCAEELVM